MKASDLEQYTGTEAYHKFSLGPMLATDGMMALFEGCSCYWVGDIVASVQSLPKVAEQSNFIIWKISQFKSGAIIEGYWD